MITNWRTNKENSSIIAILDMNEFIGEKNDVYCFYQQNNLIDSASLLDPELNTDPTYLWG